MNLKVHQCTSYGMLPRCLWIAMAMAVTLSAGQSYKTEEEHIRALIGPLQNGKVDIQNPDALVEKLRILKHSDAARAALALSLLPKERVPLSELQDAVVRGDDMVAFSAAWALRRLGDQSWTTAGVMRLHRFEKTELKLRFGADLAASGRFEGWDDVVAALQDGKAQPKVFFAALRALDSYVGVMNDAAGKPVNVCSRLWKLLPSVPEERKELVRNRVVYFQSSAFPKDLKDPHWQ